MKVYGMWYGGSSYTAPNQFDRRDVEEFKSLAHAKYVFEQRFFDSRYPCVGDDAEMQIFFYDPFEDGDAYPDRIIKQGPRRGIRIERC